MNFAAPSSVLITGAGGGLGRKLIDRLLASDWCRRIVAVDLVPPTDLAGDGRVEPVAGTLLDRGGAWWSAMADVGAVVHFAAQNPHTDATWTDVVASFDMTHNVADAALAHGVSRLVFASSNHVMGGYKDAPLASGTPGFLTVDLPPAPGTKWDTGTGWMDSTPYATAKLTGERVMAAAVANSAGTLSTVSVRIGWVQPGENRPDTINISGDVVFEPSPEPDDEAGKRDLLWYRNMWFSNRDFAGLFEAAIRADPAGWPSPAIVVNGVSANAGTGWDMEFTRRTLGFVPQDDLFAAIGNR